MHEPLDVDVEVGVGVGVGVGVLPVTTVTPLDVSLPPLHPAMSAAVPAPANHFSARRRSTIAAITRRSWARPRS
jgi:hypothetical protein